MNSEKKNIIKSRIQAIDSNNTVEPEKTMIDTSTKEQELGNIKEKRELKL